MSSVTVVPQNNQNRTYDGTAVQCKILPETASLAYTEIDYLNSQNVASQEVVMAS